ncbi:MAG: DUF2804 domain-containing protein [Leptospirales bacterium]|nr:DUF2804 domain-containing protein [Leptospirales bacterium]
MWLEEKRVLRFRRGPLSALLQLPRLLAHWRDKEWWYSGLYHPPSGVYLSWYCVRVNIADSFTITLFDPALPRPLQWTRILYTEPKIPPEQLSLHYQSRGAQFSYEGSLERGWRLRFRSGEWQADLEIAPGTSPFTKFDNEIIERYALLHLFQNTARGELCIGDRRYIFDGALGYYDHCFGRVPAQTGWHWLAVQNKDAALASLVNYGPYAQRYTEAYLQPAIPAPRNAQWVRLEQSVSFERERPADWRQPWRVSSSDMKLDLEVLQYRTNVQHIPPLTRFIVDLKHTEAYVRATGRLRIDGRWVDPGPMYGVLEEHYGRW